MKKINFDNIVLFNKINNICSEYIRCVGENNVCDAECYKCLSFDVRYNSYNFGIRIFIQENDNDIDVEVVLENICKNIDVDDNIMDTIIDYICTVTKLISDNIREYLDREEIEKKIVMDTMVVEKDDFFTNYDLPQAKIKIEELYNKFKPVMTEYSNYTNKLYLFGIRGATVSEMLKSLNIADINRVRSGYQINFIDEEARYTNKFIDEFAKELSNIGIPSMSATNEYLEYSW